MLLIIIWYCFRNYFWPWPRPRSSGLVLCLEALASASASRFWPRLTSLLHNRYCDCAINCYAAVP